MHPLARLDHQYVWHPFTQMRQWLRQKPIVIQSGKGAVLRDVEGREYLDANSSIWTNLHGHQHRRLNAALQQQLKKIAHSSALGLANEPASMLAERLIQASALAPRGRSRKPQRRQRAVAPKESLAKVFFSDDGSTALEVALKLAYAYARRTRGAKSKPRFVALEGAYHGDTVGAMSVGQIELFRKNFSKLLFPTDRVPAPYCYRCPFNRAKPERGDARTYRKCEWECVRNFEQTLVAQKKRYRESYAGFVVEPLVQGAAGMIPQPSGWLRQVTDLAHSHGTLVIADEVMTGFGRTGVTCHVRDKTLEHIEGKCADPSLFAMTRSGIAPDFLCVAKGLTAGYLPMAATLTTQSIFNAFLGEYEEFKTFFHGHSYSGNQLGAAVALASLALLQEPASIRARAQLQGSMHEALQDLWALPNVGDVRQVGLVAGVELVRDWRTREAFALTEQVGARVCAAMARRGVLTRPIGNVVVIMPPFCTTAAQVRKMISALAEAIDETLTSRSAAAAPAPTGRV